MILAVIPVLVGPLQVLLALLPAILIALGTTAVALFKPSTVKKLLQLAWRLKIQLILIAACLACVWFFADRAIGQLRPAAGSLDRGTADWPMVRGSLARAGSVPGTPGPSSGGIVWQHKKGSEAFFCSPAVVGNRVYASVADMAAFGQKGRIYSFDANTGRIAWSAAPSGYEPTFSSPVISGNFLVCGEGLHWATKARIVCLAVDTGKVLWTVPTRSHVECTPVIANDRVFIGAGDDGFYCIDLKSGKALWHLEGKDYPDAETALAVFEGKVYAGLGMGGSALCVLDAETGRELRRVKLTFPLFAPPTIDGGKIYLGTGNGDFVNPGRGGEVRCLDLKTLETDWTFPLEMTVLGSIAASGDQLYFASRDGFVYALTRVGKLVARFDAHSPISAAPAVTANHVYAVTESGVLYALNRSDLQPLWEFRLGGTPLFISAPVVALGHVYVGTQSDGFFCVGEPGTIRASASSNDGSPLPAAGAFEWNFPADQQGQNQDRLVTGASVALGDKLFAQTKNGILCVSLGESPTPELVKEFPPVAVGPIEVRSLDGTLVARDRETSRELWSVPINATTDVTIVKDQFFVGTPTHLECRSLLDGRVLWSQEAKLVAAPLVARGLLLFPTSEALMLLDLETKKVTPWMDTSWIGPVCGPLTLKDSRIYAPIAGWGIVCLKGAE